MGVDSTPIDLKLISPNNLQDTSLYHTEKQLDLACMVPVGSAGMGNLDDASRILLEAERSLRTLLEAALSEQRYSDVAAIATIVDAVARLQRQQTADTGPIREGGATAGASAVVHSNQPRPASPSGRARRAARGAEFPRFERDGDKLVKLGWSKRDERIYEHRAPRDIVFMVSTAISGKVKPRAVFTMDQVLPIKDEQGHEVPSYQAYLALAWLRSLGIVNRKGKEGYTLTNGTLDVPTLQRLWTSVPDKQ